MRDALQAAWLRRGGLAWLLWPVSLLFGALAALRRGLYRAGLLRIGRVPVPVIVVGNVVAGGAGKTPLVIALVRHLHERGWQPGVVSRGYGRRSQDCVEVQPSSPVAETGDEPLLIARAGAVPVFVARRRLDAARALLAAHPATDVIVCDDGLQHLALHRDIEICMFDDRGTGNGLLLPAGPLREPWPRRAAPAPALVLHSGARPAFAGFTARRALAPEAVRADGSRLALAALRGRPLLALAAVARPEAFFDMLRAQGLQLARTLALPDHYDFDSWKRPPDEDLPLICTEKDAVKLWRTEPGALAVPLYFEPEPAFLQALDQLLPEAPRARLSSPDASSREPLNGQQTP
ncbi:tetraacyldisaccharide 4'-kinase [Variovorax terrae]|uniref:Tetraacyldisaccharide 4'-kinase n=1 Tax=Variovorax terrae TaxID=2923278 RepID=A0A9X1VU67_9BURK|nr:tetraacyldisaccharide 4'-kinase [Variovorax terrae]MCJ0763392.1 tetraacyldisaccharide 4'-kinase [Variovorax terrae]